MTQGNNNSLLDEMDAAGRELAMRIMRGFEPSYNKPPSVVDATHDRVVANELINMYGQMYAQKNSPGMNVGAVTGSPLGKLDVLNPRKMEDAAFGIEVHSRITACVVLMNIANDDVFGEVLAEDKPTTIDNLDSHSRLEWLSRQIKAYASAAEDLCLNVTMGPNGEKNLIKQAEIIRRANEEVATAFRPGKRPKPEARDFDT